MKAFSRSDVPIAVLVAEDKGKCCVAVLNAAVLSLWRAALKTSKNTFTSMYEHGERF